MDARDKLLELIDHGEIDGEETLNDIFANYFDIDQANDCAEWLLTEYGYDQEDDV